MSDSTPVKKLSISKKHLIYSLICCQIAFVALFLGGTNHAVAVGVMVLGFVGFFYFYNRSFDAAEKEIANHQENVGG